MNSPSWIYFKYQTMKLSHLTFILLLLAGCTPANIPQSPARTPQPDTNNPQFSLDAGFRYSSYGPPYNPGADYWASVGEQMAVKFPNAKAATIWIVGVLDEEGTYLSFGCETDDPNIHCGYADDNEETLTLFDAKGFGVWLQVEPGNASVDELIDIVLDQYKHHPSVVGFGIDVEWYKSTNGPRGQPITDEEAKRWVAAVRKHNPGYELFLKHWEKDWMPPTERDGIFFVDDSQQFDTLEEMVNEFRYWGETFAPAPVGFQYGYSTDKVWWQELSDPPKAIGQVLLDNVPNTRGLFWVDFTVFDVFPPE
jgi:hypothetical protein